MAATRGEILDLLWVDWLERRDAAGDDTMKKTLWLASATTAAALLAGHTYAQTAP